MDVHAIRWVVPTCHLCPPLGTTTRRDGVGVLVGLLLWRVLPDPSGDALFHLARIRKLWALDDLSLNAVDEFVDGGIVGSPISPGAAATAGSGTISIAWHGHCSKQTAQPVQRS